MSRVKYLARFKYFVCPRTLHLHLCNQTPHDLMRGTIRVLDQAVSYRMFPARWQRAKGCQNGCGCGVSSVANGRAGHVPHKDVNQAPCPLQGSEMEQLRFVNDDLAPIEVRLDNPSPQIAHR